MEGVTSFPVHPTRISPISSTSARVAITSGSGSNCGACVRGEPRESSVDEAAKRLFVTRRRRGTAAHKEMHRHPP